jgi:hypothetical protein
MGRDTFRTGHSWLRSERRRLKSHWCVADIRNRFELVLSLPQWHVRRTLRSRKSTFVGLGPRGDIANDLAVHARCFTSHRD